MMKRMIALLACLLMLIGSAPAEESIAREVERIADGIIACEMAKCGAADVQEWIDSGLTAAAGQGAEWYVFTLSQRGAYDFSRYRAALKAYMDGAGVRTAVTEQKHVLVALAAGGEPIDCTETIGAQGVMSWVYGLHLLNNGCTASVTAADAVDALLALQLSDGGWALMGSAADADVTAMVLQALAPHARDTAVAAAADRAVTLLSQQQLDNGGYVSLGTPNPESSAQVLTALAALGVDGLSDPRFIKNGATLLDAMLTCRLPDGSFSHTPGSASNTNATVQVFYALTAWQRLQAGHPGLYLLDRRAAPADAGYKPVAAMCVAGAAAIACIALLLTGKRSRKNVLAVGLVAIALIAFVYATDFQSAGSYYAGQPAAKGAPIGTATIAIDCAAVAGQADYIPADGVILAPAAFPIAAGDTAFSLLTDAARTHSIHMEHSGGYVAGLGYLYEFAYGDLSGWMYFINGESASVGADQYIVQDGDLIQWRYTLELGADLK